MPCVFWCQRKLAVAERSTLMVRLTGPAAKANHVRSKRLNCAQQARHESSYYGGAFLTRRRASQVMLDGVLAIHALLRSSNPFLVAVNVLLQMHPESSSARSVLSGCASFHGGVRGLASVGVIFELLKVYPDMPGGEKAA